MCFFQCDIEFISLALLRKKPEASSTKSSKKPEEDPKRKSARQKERSVDLVDEFESEVTEDEKKPKSQGNNDRKKK